ncbi:IS66 family insertion sequence element accessory protein TnpA [Vibrio mediterranei]
MTSRRTPNDWQTIIDQYQASGLKASEFCRQNNNTASNFYAWRKKLLEDPNSRESSGTCLCLKGSWRSEFSIFESH